MLTIIDRTLYINLHDIFIQVDHVAGEYNPLLFREERIWNNITERLLSINVKWLRQVSNSSNKMQKLDIIGKIIKEAEESYFTFLRVKELI